MVVAHKIVIDLYERVKATPIDLPEVPRNGVHRCTTTYMRGVEGKYALIAGNRFFFRKNGITLPPQYDRIIHLAALVKQDDAGTRIVTGAFYHPEELSLYGAQAKATVQITTHTIRKTRRGVDDLVCRFFDEINWVHDMLSKKHEGEVNDDAA